jgi:hypothetical protein
MSWVAAATIPEAVSSISEIWDFFFEGLRIAGLRQAGKLVSQAGHKFNGADVGRG